MAPESRRHTASLKQELFERASAFDFFQAVRLLHKLRPGREGVGRDADPARERCVSAPTRRSCFGGDIREITAGESDARRDVVKLIGIASPSSFGSLPNPTWRGPPPERQLKNPAMREFFDLFNHRLVALFYRAWERSRLPVLPTSAWTTFESALFAVLGCSARRSTRACRSIRRACSRAPVSWRAPAPASAIESIRRACSACRRVSCSSCRAGMRSTRATAAGRHRERAVGVDLHLGEQVLLVQSRFRSRSAVRPQALSRSAADSSEFAALSSVVRLAAGVEFDFDVQILLAAAEVPGHAWLRPRRIAARLDHLAAQGRNDRGRARRDLRAREHRDTGCMNAGRWIRWASISDH